MVTTYSYDRVQRLTDLTNARAGATITSHAYTLDNEGDRTALSEFVSGITPAGTTDGFTMGYDGLLRLTAVAVTNPEGFTLDGASNVTARTGPAATFSYDQANRLTSDGTSAYTWSAADRLVQRGADTFSYDALDRLTGATVAGTPRSYAYDGDGLLATRAGRCRRRSSGTRRPRRRDSSRSAATGSCTASARCTSRRSTARRRPSRATAARACAPR